jgi:hypothetical protein
MTKASWPMNSPNSSELIVFGVDADEKKVAAGRAALLPTGLYGPRITLDHLDLALMPYSSYFANLIVGDSAEPGGVPVDVARHLKPIGGKFCFKATPKTDAWLAETKLVKKRPRSLMRTAGRCSRARRFARREFVVASIRQRGEHQRAPTTAASKAA